MERWNNGVLEYWEKGSESISHIIIPLLQHSITPFSPYSNTPVLQYSITQFFSTA
jgi:hypothetical protein